MELNEIFSKYVKNELAKHKFYSYIAQVVSVDIDNMLCEVSFINGDANKDVRLGSVISEDDTALNNNSIIQTSIENQCGNFL